MQFYLPSNLQNAVAAYDPTKKAQRKVAAKSRPKKTSGHPLGNPCDLIPPEVVKPSSLQFVIDSINSNAAAQRYHSFSKVELLENNPFLSEERVHAFILHLESLWLAVWLPPEGQKGEYVFGYARAFKDNEKSRGMISSLVRDKIINDGELVTYGRSSMYVERKLVTLKDMQDKADSQSRRWLDYTAPWDLICYGYEKTREMRKCVEKFESTLSAYSNNWEGQKWYDRMLCRTPLDAVDIKISSKLYEFIGQSSTSTNLTVDFLISLSDYLNQQDKGTMLLSSEEEIKKLCDIKTIIKTPLIKKWIQNKLDFINNVFNDLNCKDKKQITDSWKPIDRCLNNIWYVKSIWEDCPIDYYSSNLDLLSKTQIRTYGTNKAAKLWLASNMPVASFFQILKKFSESEAANRFSGFSDWTDTVNMIQTILTHPEYKQDLKTPKRWRLSEFHDYIQSESWKLKNDNIALPQDLFPEPVKVVTADGRVWSFFQPIDTHQLAQWGQAVRNCVGNATHYAEDVKKKKHFIVLCNLDRLPTFTIQLKVDGGVMSVTQIVSTSNRRLSQDELSDYGQAFQMALLQRETQLNSGQSTTDENGSD